MSERSRSVLYLALSNVIADERAVQEMLSNFSARDVEEAVTKEHFRAEIAVFRAEVHTEFAAVRGEMALGFAEQRADFRVELREALRQRTQWLIGIMVTLCTLVLAVSAVIR